MASAGNAERLARLRFDIVIGDDQQTYNAVHCALRGLGERANSLFKTADKALRRYRGCPWRIGRIVAAALVLLHREHHRIT